MRVVETLALGGRRQLILVACGSERFLVGSGAGSSGLDRARDADRGRDMVLNPGGWVSARRVLFGLRVIGLVLGLMVWAAVVAHASAPDEAHWVSRAAGRAWVAEGRAGAQGGGVASGGWGEGSNDRRGDWGEWERALVDRAGVGRC